MEPRPGRRPAPRGPATNRQRKPTDSAPPGSRQPLPLGKNIILQVDGTGSAARTNAYAYDDSGRLLSATHPDGGWEIYQYDAQGRQVNRFSPWLNSAPTTNSANCRLTTLDYSTNT